MKPSYLRAELSFFQREILDETMLSLLSLEYLRWILVSVEFLQILIDTMDLLLNLYELFCELYRRPWLD